MYVGLGDLDEMVLRCRDTKAREYLAEAVASYKAGAYRSTIIATWVAVNFDLIGKLRSLSLAGSSEAATWVEKYDVIRLNYDPENYKSAKPALEFERELIERVAKPDLELLSAVEVYDLKRLRQDRHRCAHPTMQNAEERFSPTAELARYHLRNAVDYVLSRPAIQGKFILAKFQSIVQDEGFPSQELGAKQVFEEEGLSVMRPNDLSIIVRSVILDILDGEQKAVIRTKLLASLQALRGLYGLELEELVRPIIRECANGLDENSFGIWIGLFGRAPWIYGLLNSRSKMTTVLLLKKTDIATRSGQGHISHAFAVEELRGEILDLMHKAEYAYLYAFKSFVPEEEFCSEIARRLPDSSSYSESISLMNAGLWASLASTSIDDLRGIVLAFAENRQFREVYRACDFMLDVANTRSIDSLADEWRRVLTVILDSQDDVQKALVQTITEGLAAKTPITATQEK